MSAAVDSRITAGSVLFGSSAAPAAIEGELNAQNILAGTAGGLSHLSREAYRAVTGEVSQAVADQLDIDIVAMLVGAWRKHALLIEAAERTADAPGSTEVVDLATEHLSGSWRPYFDLVLDGIRIGRVHAELILDLTVVGVVANVKWGRLVAVRSGRCTVHASLEIEGFVIRRATVGFDIPAVVRLGNGLPLLPDPPTTVLPTGR